MSGHIATPDRTLALNPAQCCSLTPTEMRRMLGTRPAST